MTFSIHVPTPDPYVGLFRLQGGKSQVLCHGDDLPAGSLVEWEGRHGALKGNVAGSPSSNATGWSGAFKTLDITTDGQWVDYNAEASNYGAATSFLWIGASKFTASALGRGVVFLGAAGANNYRGFTINATNDFAYMLSNRSGVAENDTQNVAVAEGVQCIWAVHLKSGTATILQQTSSGSTTLISTTHAQSGSLVVDRFTLGALITGGTQSGASCYGSHRFFSAMRAPSANAADLPNIINYVRHRLRCPL